MKGRLRMLLPIVLLIGVALAFWYAVQHREKPLPANQIAGNGTVETTEVDVAARIPGRLATVTPHEGDDLQAGQIVATLEAADLLTQVQQAEGAYRSAQANLDELLAGTRKEDIARAQAQYQASVDALREAQARLALVRAGTRKEEIEQARAAVNQAQATLDDAQTSLRRAESLEKQGAIAKEQADQARTRRDVAAAQLEAAQQRLLEAQRGARPEELRAAQEAAAQAASRMQAAKAQLDLARAGARPETIAAARARAEQAKAAWDAAQVQLTYARIPCPLAGTVTLRNLEPGEYVSPGTPILRVAALERVWLRVYVSETDLGRVKLGQRSFVTTDTYPDKRYEGRVTEISPQAEFTPRNVQTKEEREKLVYGVKVTVDNPHHDLKPGMPGDAVIVVK